MRRILPILALSTLLCACAGNKDAYPSLARRPIERVAAESPAPAPVPTPALPSAELLARIETLVAQAAKANAAFRAHEGRTRDLVIAAVGSTVASDPWSLATVALAGLEASRSEAMVALAELDAIYATRTVAGEDLATISAARTRVVGLVEGQDAVLADLRGRMPS